MAMDLDEAIKKTTLDLAKMLVMASMQHRIGSKIAAGDRGQFELQREAEYHIEELRRRNDVFRDLPRIYASLDGADMSLRWAGELS